MIAHEEATKLQPPVITADMREKLILEHLPQVKLIARRIHEFMTGFPST